MKAYDVFRYLECFQLGEHGVCNLYTTKKAINAYDYIKKSNLFTYKGKYYPAFDLCDMAGRKLRVIGVGKPTSTKQELDEIEKNPAIFCNMFFKTLNDVIEQMPMETQTRKNNLAFTGVNTNVLPRYVQIFPEDIGMLSNLLKRALAERETVFKYYFIIYWYGQQKIIRNPLTLKNTSLDSIVAKPNKVEGASLHLAVNFTHIDQNFVLVWDRQRTAALLHGKDILKFPMMGLHEIGSVKSSYLTTTVFHQAWEANRRPDVHITYAQAYMPFPKPYVDGFPFQGHPHLLAALLGREHIRSQRCYAGVVHSTDSMKDYLQLKEGLILLFEKGSARMEFVVSSGQLETIMTCNLQELGSIIQNGAILVQVRPKFTSFSISNALHACTRSPKDISRNTLSEWSKSYMLL